MNRMRKDCPICLANVQRISNHLKQVHNIDGDTRTTIINSLKSGTKQSELKHQGNRL